MSKTIDRLLTDHQRLSAVLESISAVRKELQSDDFESHSDYLFCLVDYLLGYPDKVHHPTEDRVFDKLLELNLTEAQLEKVKHNRAQHETLASATIELMDLVEMPAGGMDDAEQFLEKLEEYATLQRKHMEFEEQEIFPLALECIGSTMWEELDEHFGEASDPLFDETDRRYASLFRLLVPGEHEAARLVEPIKRYLAATGTTLEP